MDLSTEIQREVQRCVACGLCVPRCPTYRKTLNEADSPRGRVALAAALARGELPWSERLQSHLDLCLDCRACERICPSEVAYGRLYDLVRAHLEALRPAGRWRRRLRRLALDTLTSPQRLDRIGRLLQRYQHSPLPALLRRSRLLALFGLEALERNLPPLRRAQVMARVHRAGGRRQRRGAVALFTGCVARLTDPDTLEATVRLLVRLGYDVHIPAHQGCCGALHQHSGELDAARERMRVNLRAFGDVPVEAIVVSASGCAAWLREYAQWLGREAEDFSAKIAEVSTFLDRSGALDGERFAPLDGRRIAVHDPCTLSNVLRETEAVYRLLRRLPGAEVFPLPENEFCCGGAGWYPLLQPQMAGRLRADKLEHVARLAPHVLATSNVGCAMHLAAGLREAGLAIEIVHPVVLLERQLRK